VGASNELALASGGGSSAVKIFLVLTALSFGTALVCQSPRSPAS